MTETAISPPRRAQRRSLVVRALPWLCTVALLLGIAGDRFYLRQPSADAAPYHARVQLEAQKLPFHFGDWLGTDVPVPQGAVKMLKPNVILSRRFEQMGTGRRVTVLLIQCKDARDILGHYPPVCYPGQGWQLVAAEPRDWRIDDLTVRGTRYIFKTGHAITSDTTVDNFMILPDGQTARNMDEVETAAQDLRRKYFGAAQVQLVYDGSVELPEREQIRQAFVRMLRPTLDSIAQRKPGENRS